MTKAEAAANKEIDRQMKAQAKKDKAKEKEFAKELATIKKTFERDGICLESLKKLELRPARKQRQVPGCPEPLAVLAGCCYYEEKVDDVENRLKGICDEEERLKGTCDPVEARATKKQFPPKELKDAEDKFPSKNWDYVIYMKDGVSKIRYIAMKQCLDSQTTVFPFIEHLTPATIQKAIDNKMPWARLSELASVKSDGEVLTPAEVAAPSAMAAALTDAQVTKLQTWKSVCEALKTEGGLWVGHTSMTVGLNVEDLRFAGTISTNDKGKVIKIDNASGHYTPKGVYGTFVAEKLGLGDEYKIAFARRTHFGDMLRVVDHDLPLSSRFDQSHQQQPHYSSQQTAMASPYFDGYASAARQDVMFVPPQSNGYYYMPPAQFAVGSFAPSYSADQNAVLLVLVMIVVAFICCVCMCGSALIGWFSGRKMAHDNTSKAWAPVPQEDQV
eukprot:CAMPEP_0202686372 /NCGR_PEP_ID=MMETSP1385-20130828/2184_1 /ASSEMBLY_ACC=CAM_ASM_000861 /TAXON_ID=933848 /ORGANISM="Elphidium margaritaceum" /LENGTH=443 /DNA_ID=CAMNT_0049340937 /DNA_START=106 /DNA_END=1437 /DNA_ORIENTATION=+